MHYHQLLSFLWLLLLPCLSTATTNNVGSTLLPPSTLTSIQDGVEVIESQQDDVGSITSVTSTTTTDSVSSNNDLEEWRQSLPPGLRNEKGAPLHRIEMGDGVILYLLGSSHVSRTSCDDAKLLMQHVRPDVLFVELCSQRVGLLLDPPTPPITESEDKQQIKQTKEQEAVVEKSAVARGSLLYAKIQSDYAKKLNVTIGGEFRESFQAALSQQRQFWNSQQQQQRPWGIYDQYLDRDQPQSSASAPSNAGETIINNEQVGSSLDSNYLQHPRGIRPCAIVLGDRPVRITLVRAWESLRLFGKVKLMLALLWSSIKQPSEKELREWMESILNDRSGKNDLITKAMEELGKAFPTLKRVIIEERDEFMVAKLRQTARILSRSSEFSHGGEKVIVAVVGAGHCAGMVEKLVQKGDVLDSKEDNSGDEAGSCSSTIANPEEILPSLIETKKRKLDNYEEKLSLITDIVQFDYSSVFENDVQ